MSRGAKGSALSFDSKRSSSCSASALHSVLPSWTWRLARTILAVSLCSPLPRSTSRLSCIPSSLSHGPSIAYSTASSCRISVGVPGTQNNHPPRRSPGLFCAAFAVRWLAALESAPVSPLAPRISSSCRTVECLIMRATAVVDVAKINSKRMFCCRVLEQTRSHKNLLK